MKTMMGGLSVEWMTAAELPGRIENGRSIKVYILASDYTAAIVGAHLIIDYWREYSLPPLVAVTSEDADTGVFYLKSSERVAVVTR